ncbi:MAG: hypothetical protein ABIT70_04590 [Sulfuriferula sp.]
MTLIDTHCHLDAAEFDADRDTVATLAHAAGVQTLAARRCQLNFSAANGHPVYPRTE